MAASQSRRWWALGAITLAVLVITLDVTVLTVALPTLAGALNASASDLQWFVTAYTLALVAGMLPAGLLGDRYGRKVVMIGALVLFAVGSIGCAVAPSPGSFIVARVVLGLAGAALIVIALSIVTVLFDEAERPRAIGIWGAANFIGLPLGPILGGWMLTHIWWGWIFLMNVPVAAIALIAVIALVPESRSARRPSIDGVGVLLSSTGLVGFMYGLVQAGDYGWGSSNAVVPSVIGLVVLAAFVLWERRLAAQPDGQPLVDLSLFRSRAFTWGIVLTALGVFGLFGVLFALPQYFQAIMDLDPQGSGFRLLPVIAGLIAGAVLADRVAQRLGVKLTVAAGFAVMGVGLAIGTGMTATSGDGFIALWTVIAGAGAGLVFATAASSALVELSAERSGVGSALLQVIVKLGPAFGATILGSIVNATYQAHLSLAGLPADAVAAVQASVFSGLAIAHQLDSAQLIASVQAAFVAGVDDGVRTAAIVAGAGVVLALLFMPSRHPALETANAPFEASPVPVR